MSKSNKKQPKKPFYKTKRFRRNVLVVAGLLIAAVMAFRLSPWPGALIIRTVFNHNGSSTLKAMQEALPSYPVRVIEDQEYREDDKSAKLDVYIPESAQATTPLPVVIWTHGGAWISGDKKDAAPYFSRMANEGFVVVSVNYALAPAKTYPYALHQLNDAHAFVRDNAAKFNLNPDKVFLAGDSAGAQLSSQLATIITNPAYAIDLNVKPALTPTQLRGALLFSGIYKMDGLVEFNHALPEIVRWGNDTAVWAYTGTRDRKAPQIRQMSSYYHVTRGFPATFITGGNGDTLTKEQSTPMANKLIELGVDVTTLFYADDHSPSLPHEYQFTFDEDGEKAFERVLDFLRAKS